MSGEGLWWKPQVEFSSHVDTQNSSPSLLPLSNSFMSELVKSYGQEFFIALMLHEKLQSERGIMQSSFVVLASSDKCVWRVIRPFPFSHTHNTVMKNKWFSLLCIHSDEKFFFFLLTLNLKIPSFFCGFMLLPHMIIIIFQVFSAEKMVKIRRMKIAFSTKFSSFIFSSFKTYTRSWMK